MEELEIQLQTLMNEKKNKEKAKLEQIEYVKKRDAQIRDKLFLIREQ